MVSKEKEIKACGLLTKRGRSCGMQVVDCAPMQRLAFDTDRTMLYNERGSQDCRSRYKTQAQELAEDTVVDVIDAGCQVTCVSLMVDTRTTDGGDVAAAVVNVKSRQDCHRHKNRQ